MADDNNRQNISRIDDESITEIDLGSFLAGEKGTEAVYEGFHADMEKAEKSLEDELQNLYDNIMKPVAAPKITVEPPKVKEEKPQSELEAMWLSPEEYIDIPKVPAESESAETIAIGSRAVDSAKKDIFNMIESLKSEADKEQGFDEIISGINNNKGIEPADTNLVNTEELTKEVSEVIKPELDLPLSPDMLAEPEIVKEEIKAPEPVAPVLKPENSEGIDTDSKEFNEELSELLGELPLPPAQEEKPVYVETPVSQPVSIIDSQPSQAPVFVDSLTRNQRTVGVVPTEIKEDNGKITRKQRKQAKLEAKMAEGKGKKEGGAAGEVVRKLVLAVAILTIIGSSGWLAYTYLYEPNKYKSDASTIQESIDIEAVGTVEVEENGKYPKGMMAKYTQLYDINPDLKGWISIPGLEINLPIVQGKDNDYYLHKNIYQKKTQYGVPFFDYRVKDFNDLPRNLVVYGHNMHYDDLIFGLLENYRDIDGYIKNPVIECNTIYGDHKWFVYAVFITGSRASQDNGYLFPYNFVDLSDENFKGYINEIDKRKFYTTGVDINETDKILTLSTCCYDFQDARLVVVARLMRDGESPVADTSRVVKNENPKYPQAWYDANKKANPYESDSLWDPTKK